MNGTKVVTFGEVMVRLEPPGFGRLVQSIPGTMTARFAGAEANVASSVALLGGSSEFVTAIPTHAVGDALIRELKANGVETSRIVRLPGSRLGLFYSERGANQRGSLVIYDREHSAVAQAPGTSYDWAAAFEGAGWFHTTGITPAISENAAEATKMAVAEAARRGLTVSCDLNFRSSLWKWDGRNNPKALARATMPPILESARLIIGNEADAEDVLGISPEGSDVERGLVDAERYSSVARQVARRFPGVRYIAFTLRESLSASHNRWGAMLYVAAEDAAYFAPDTEAGYAPYEITDIVDRVGGGDSFAGSLILGLTEGMAPQEALSFAVAYSCLAHSIEGDIKYVSRSEVRRLLDVGGSGRVQR